MCSLSSNDKLVRIRHWWTPWSIGFIFQVCVQVLHAGNPSSLFSWMCDVTQVNMVFVFEVRRIMSAMKHFPLKLLLRKKQQLVFVLTTVLYTDKMCIKLFTIFSHLTQRSPNFHSFFKFHVGYMYTIQPNMNTLCDYLISSNHV